MASESIRITLALADAPRSVLQCPVVLAAGSTVADALRATPLLTGRPGAWVDALQVALRGKAVALDTPLQDGDRIDLCRPLKVDPKMARRERFAKQGARGTGLFSKRRAGAKSGY